MRNKLLILANSSSGLFDFRKELISELQTEYEVVASVPENDKADELEAIGCRIVGIYVDRRGVNPANDFILLKQYIKLIAKEKPAMVLTYTIKPNVYGGLACQMKKIPYVSNITGLGTAFQKDGVLRKLVVFLYKIGLKRAKTVFFENVENQQIFINEKIVKEEKVCLLNGAGVNLEHFQVAEYPKDIGNTRFLFVGRVMREKGIDEVFQAMQKLRQESIKCSLDILGSFEEDYKEMIEKYEAEGWLKYYGYQEDVRPFIARAHCFVLPSWHEGMANTNLECASMGRPVITSNIHGCLEAVEDGVTGFLCEKQDADNLYVIMKKFTELPYEERKEMGLAGRRRMEELFDKRNVVAKTIEALL